jgi:glucose/arabinose dehydrogenase
MLAFSSNDNYLYVGMGDGGSAGDPEKRAQDSTELLGKILRLDVNKANGTLVPNSNPFVGRPGWRGEIWAYGLRNPWRFSFDRTNGDLYIGEVGQNLFEEVDFQLGTSTGGQNYGWRLKEGFHCFNPASNCDPGGLTDPVQEYGHTSGRCSITGGYVYRGCAIPDLNGTYFFGDYCTGNIYSFVKTVGGTTAVTDRTAELGSLGMNISSFGQDAFGEIYIVDYSGSIYKIVPNGTPSQCSVPPCCDGTTGNVNLTGIVDLSDLSALVSFLTGSVYQPPCPAEANIDGAGTVDLADLARLVGYLTGAGATLAACA